MSATSEHSARHSVAPVEDHKDIRERWLEIVGASEHFTCACACTSAEEALRKIPAFRPEVILMDIFLPKMSGIECTARIKEQLPDTRILVERARHKSTSKRKAPAEARIFQEEW